jgi:putative metalloprotease
LFHKLDAMREQGLDMPAWMMSHPPSTDRIAAIKANESRWLNGA